MAHIKRTTDTPEAAQISSILDQYLESSALSPSDAASQLMNVTETLAGSIPEAELGDAAGPIYHEILYRARTVPYDDPIQDQLVDLLRAIQSHPPESGRIEWPALAPLGITVRELWNTAPDESRASWTALNGFVAKVTAEAILDFDVYAVWALRSACEDWTGVPGATDELDATALNVNIPAGAVWVLNAGEKIWALSTEAKEGDRVTRGGPRWRGPNGFSVGRWKFWHQRFDEFSKREDLDELARELATKAHNAGDALKRAGFWSTVWDQVCVVRTLGHGQVLWSVVKNHGVR